MLMRVIEKNNKKTNIQIATSSDMGELFAFEFGYTIAIQF